MKISEQIQHVIHEMEVGRVSRWLQLTALVLAVVALAVVYDVTNYRGFASVEAMDAAQVGRNVAEGRGFSTDFIRPFSVYLLQKHSRAAANDAALTNSADVTQLHGPHPDLANAPLYPLVLAGLFKITNPEWAVNERDPFWSVGRKFLRYKPEFLIAVFNQLLLVAVVAMTFVLARRLFDVQAAWLAALLTLGAEILWKFSIAGQSTLLLLLIFLSLAWVLSSVEERGRMENPDLRRLFLLAILAGVLTGLGMLTRYAFGWLIVPVVVFLAIFGGVRRPGLAVAAFLAFAVVVTPWLLRNLAVSGTWFGTAGYAVVEGTFAFPGSKLMQSVNPDLTSAYWVRPYVRKFLENIRLVLQDDLLRLAGGWVVVLFLSGLLLALRTQAARRLQVFLLMSLGVFMMAQALGRTHLSQVSPDVNSENLLVLLVPLIIIFGVAFFLTLLNQIKTPSLDVRLGVVALLAVVCCQPLVAALLPPRSSPIAYPPYYPPEIQKISGWMRPNEIIMSDVPWAVAWYGRQQSVWTTVNSDYEFFLFNDHAKHVSGLFLTLGTLDQKLFTECLQGGVDSWGNFVFKTVAANQIPPQFPLKVAPYGLMSGLFLTDRQRWDTE